MTNLSLAHWVVANYNLTDSVTVSLLRSYTNDVYLVTAGAERFVLKVYGLGWRTEEAIRYEVALLQQLATQGMCVPAPLSGRNTDTVQRMAMTDKERYAVLFEYAPGAKPSPPFTPSLYRAFGQAIACMHTLSDDFTTAYSRYPLDLAHLLDAPLALALPHLPSCKDRDFLCTLADNIRDRITTLAANLDWGPIHGDASLDNLHITPDGEVILYDFDSGGPGWRAADLQGWAVHRAEYAERWESFSEGYSEIRPISESDFIAAPYLTVAWDIWGIQIDLERRILAQGDTRIQAYLSEQLTLLRERQRTLLL